MKVNKLYLVLINVFKRLFTTLKTMEWYLCLIIDFLNFVMIFQAGVETYLLIKKISQKYKLKPIIFLNLMKDNDRKTTL